MGIDIPTGTPSAGDVFNWAGTQYVYRTNPDRWDTNGFIGPDPDPFANFTLTTFNGVDFSTGNIGLQDDAPFNFDGQNAPQTPNQAVGAGIASSTTATSGVIALWQTNRGSGSGVLFPTDLVGTGSIMGPNVSDFDDFTTMKVTVNGNVRRAGFSSTAQSSGGSFGLGGPGQVMAGGLGLSIDDSTITNDADVTRIDFRIPAGGTGTEGHTVVLLREETHQSTITSTNTGNAGGNSRVYNYRWGVLAEDFVAAEPQ